MTAAPSNPTGVELTIWQTYLQLLNAPRAKHDESRLDLIASLGLATSTNGQIDPVPITQGLLRRAMTLEGQAKRMRRASEIIAGIEAEPREGEPASYRYFADAKQFRAFWIDLHARAQSLVEAWDPLGAIMGGDFFRKECEVLSRGVVYQALYPKHILDNPTMMHRVETAVAQGQEARVSSTTMLMLKVAICDKSEVALAIANSEGKIAGYHVTHEGLVSIFKGMFQELWQQATPMALRRRRSHAEPKNSEPTSESLQLLAMLSRGMTDQAIARELGVSERTAARRVADLCDVLGAKSRFQLGVEAARQGWVR